MLSLAEFVVRILIREPLFVYNRANLERAGMDVRTLSDERPRRYSRGATNASALPPLLQLSYEI